MCATEFLLQPNTVLYPNLLLTGCDSRRYWLAVALEVRTKETYVSHSWAGEYLTVTTNLVYEYQYENVMYTRYSTDHFLPPATFNYNAGSITRTYDQTYVSVFGPHSAGETTRAHWSSQTSDWGIPDRFATVILNKEEAFAGANLDGNMEQHPSDSYIRQQRYSYLTASDHWCTTSHQELLPWGYGNYVRYTNKFTGINNQLNPTWQDAVFTFRNYIDTCNDPARFQPNQTHEFYTNVCNDGWRFNTFALSRTSPFINLSTLNGCNSACFMMYREILKTDSQTYQEATLLKEDWLECTKRGNVTARGSYTIPGYAPITVPEYP